MKRPTYLNYSGLRESKLLDYSTDQDKYIDYLEKQLQKERIINLSLTEQLDERTS